MWHVFLTLYKDNLMECSSKRDENLALANTLARTGKHNLAREHYVKCVDITPQMAFQLIKVRKNCYYLAVDLPMNLIFIW